MIVLLGLVIPRVIPERWVTEARANLTTDAAPDVEPDERLPLRTRLRSRAGWGDASGYTVSDLTMLRTELVIGFVVAGFLAALVPDSFWTRSPMRCVCCAPPAWCSPARTAGWCSTGWPTTPGAAA